MERQNLVEPPDGGWGWMIVLGTGVINMVNQAMFANFGLIFGEYLKEIGGGHATGITLVLALSVVVTNFAGLIVGPLLKILEIRTFTLIGIGCVGTGMIVSSFGTATWHIVIGYSVMTGFGLGLLASGTFLIINDYFTTKKSTAVGISMAGTAVGQMTMPLFIGWLLKKYEYSGTTFILGFISYSGAIGALFFKPILCCKKWAPAEQVAAIENGPEKPEKEKINSVSTIPKPEEEKLLKVPNGERKVSITERNGHRRERKISSGEWERKSAERKLSKSEGGARGMIKSYSQAMIKDHVDVTYKESAIEMASSQFHINKGDEKKHWLRKISKALGFELLKDPIYVHIVVGLGLVYVSTVSFGAFFPIFLQDEANLNMIQTTTTMTALSSADVLGRVTASEICRRLKMSNRKTFMFGATLLAIMRSVEVLMPSYLSLAIVAFIVGYFRAIAVINQNLVISEYIPKEKLPSAVGLNMVTKALLQLTFGQALGLLKDLWSYAICIHTLNVITIVVIVSWSFEIFITGLRTKNTEEEDTKPTEVNS
uniref:Monocarboxylate transporter 9-like isoform X2 n=1 Tax=Diabrotica virgifera virgifera TaxID=50390 RepID=A0A6P7F783_DIAVI